MAKSKDAKAGYTAKGKALRETGAKWLERISAAGKKEKHWLDDAAEATCVYTGEGRAVETSESGSITGQATAAFDFNILFANVETTVPAIINSPPSPDIRRRFGNADPVARDLAELLERSTRIQVDDSKLQVELESVAQDGVLAGRGVIRLRFRSDFIKDMPTDGELAKAADASGSDTGSENGSAADDDNPDRGQGTDQGVSERLANERIGFEAVSWRDCRHGPATRWENVPWWAFRHSIGDMDELADADLVDCQTRPEDKAWDCDDDNCVWEVWDKKTRQVCFVAEDGRVLRKVDDPLGLTNFFPIATPVQPIEVTGRLMPVNPFSIYKKLAVELDITTKRIAIITKQMKVKGWYGISPADIAAVIGADDNEFVPIADAEVWAANGGLQNAILFWPVEKLIVVLAQLYQLRDQSKQAIYEITGISDIVRGASKATETLGAQQIKSQWGSLRIQKMQRMMERAARDLFVMMSEIIPTKFSHETLQRMTDVQIVPTEQDLTPVQPQITPEMAPEMQQQAQQQAQQAEAARQAKLQHMARLQELMKEKLSSFYRIDVETDSTVRADLTQQKAEATGFMQAASGYFAAVGPLVQQGALPLEVAVEIFSSFSRLFNLGKTVEDALDEMVTRAKSAAGQQQQQKPDPAAEAAAAEQKRKADEADLDRQIKVEDATANRKIKADDADLSNRIKATQLQIEQTRLAMVQRQAAAQQFAQQFGAGQSF